MDDADGCYDNGCSVGGVGREVGRWSKGCCTGKENKEQKESIQIH